MSNAIEKCPVPLLQEPWEFEQLIKVFQRFRPSKVLEIGSFYGGTLWHWSRDVKITLWENGPNVNGWYGEVTQIVSVDLPIGPSDSRYEEMIACRSLWPEWMKGISFHDIQGDSHATETIARVQEIFPGNDVDFLFIDGDHSYGGVKADFENYSKMVRLGGLIVLHDVYGLPEVAQYWRELKKTHRTTEIVGQPGGWGIGIIEKH